MSLTAQMTPYSPSTATNGPQSMCPRRSGDVRVVDLVPPIFPSVFGAGWLYCYAVCALEACLLFSSSPPTLMVYRSLCLRCLSLSSLDSCDEQQHNPV